MMQQGKWLARVQRLEIKYSGICLAYNIRWRSNFDFTYIHIIIIASATTKSRKSYQTNGRPCLVKISQKTVISLTHSLSVCWGGEMILHTGSR